MSRSEFRDIDLPGGAIRDNILPLPFQEPSGTLTTGGCAYGEAAGCALLRPEHRWGQPKALVGTTLALIERSMKVMSAVPRVTQLPAA